MASEVSGTIPPRQLRRSARQSSSLSSSSSAHAVKYRATPRGPLKRTQQPSKREPVASVVNGTNSHDSEDEDPPKKKSCPQNPDIQAVGDWHDPPRDDMEPMDTEDHSDRQEDAKSDIKSLQRPDNAPVVGDVLSRNLKPYVVLGERCSLTHPETVIKPQVQEQKRKDPSPLKHIKPTVAATPINKPIVCDTHHERVMSIADYQRRIADKLTEFPKVNHSASGCYPKPVTITKTKQHTTETSTRKIGVVIKQDTKKPSCQKAQTSTKGSSWYFMWLVFLMLLGAALLLVYKQPPIRLKTKEGGAHSSKFVNSGLFVEELSRVAARFPSQRPELWKRSQIHLQKHLDHLHPTEPVSMILTAGVRAQKTMLCLALNIATAFSSALNASVLLLEGTREANSDSDQVKINIDEGLKEAFGGDKLAAVVHRFEEIPPGSTLVFYRYCDHETAAYKRAFILFTVLLSEEDISTQQSLKAVEEMVRDHIEKRFVGKETAFNKMDADKFSGLWSRIAHLVLPVAYEEDVEQKGC